MTNATKLVPNIIERLIALINTQGLQDGAKLPAERKLCEQFGVSRTSLREAIQQMNGIGITESRIGSGTFVKHRHLTQQPMSLVSLTDTLADNSIVQTLTPLMDADPLYRLDVQEARIVLEGGTAWYAAQRASKADIEKIHFFYQQLADSQAHADTEQAAIADANFHLAIAEASQNAVLLQMMKNVFHLLRHNVVLARRKIYTKHYDFDTLHAQHFAIMQAIRQQDAEQARKVVGEHIEFVIQQVAKIDANEARRQRIARLALEG